MKEALGSSEGVTSQKTPFFMTWFMTEKNGGLL
jgi:hypothetical protein